MGDEMLAFNLTVDETDVVLIALEEKAKNILKLKQRIYDNASNQIANIQEIQAIKEATIKQQKKGKK